MNPAQTVSQTEIPGLSLLHRGKVRDVYAIDEDRLLLVATDRISAFDCVMPNQIPQKGAILTALSEFWFNFLSDVSPNHLISTDSRSLDETSGNRELVGRSTIVRRTKVFPVECVVRGYLEGSGWKDYRATGKVCGHVLPEDLEQCSKLESPIFTPATKAASGHDENIPESRFAEIVGEDVAEELKRRTLEIYAKASAYAAERGIIIADTKFEFGQDREGKILLIDEVLTPDSSRFWSVASYEPGHAQPSFDKQFLREYLESIDWDKTPPAPDLPEEIVQATAERYREAFRLITGTEFTDD
ncbi:MAG: phosphoribosylaminoimidazolesuccinocarboxamide synthase [Acidobacteria bacterium]|nr:MAG: phosphoribosylaminoimidazolesuccinocarboxamide synthase [Acidobacteriota bacterium]REK01144.1 MAG: phosphoribosylaminoimidazolesuccinocarboxamide synthase [Acidobacteriota bacterium]REK14100.1 MAG: phosphoribosylaminoimidazolesuccinocarboxamide synthase [Acidobacteriota bacterium]REK44815.1 MAG: phosphoribosylaminoimidazolesuccinocarboxamide synthase [Acidobacteriota bacterium]